MRHGLWKFYDPQTGKLLKEEEYQVDELVYSHRFNLTKADSLASQQKIKRIATQQRRCLQATCQQTIQHHRQLIFDL